MCQLFFFTIKIYLINELYDKDNQKFELVELIPLIFKIKVDHFRMFDR